MKKKIAINLKTIRWLIMLAVAVFHLVLLLAVKFNTAAQQKRDDVSIFKVVDVKEAPPAPSPKPKPKKKQVLKVMKQDAVAEDIIKTEKEVEEVSAEEINYMPQHKISKMPVIDKQLLRSRVIYPPIAKKKEISGVVYLELFIDSEGNILKVRILKDPGFGFGEAARKGLLGMKVHPAEANGEKTAARVRYPVVFKLQG